jgi:chaperone required for assembly of F1-ATPase
LQCIVNANVSSGVSQIQLSAYETVSDGRTIGSPLNRGIVTPANHALSWLINHETLNSLAWACLNSELVVTALALVN